MKPKVSDIGYFRVKVTIEASRWLTESEPVQVIKVPGITTSLVLNEGAEATDAESLVNALAGVVWAALAADPPASQAAARGQELAESLKRFADQLRPGPGDLMILQQN